MQLANSPWQKVVRQTKRTATYLKRVIKNKFRLIFNAMNFTSKAAKFKNVEYLFIYF